MEPDLLLSPWNKVRERLLATLDKFSPGELGFAPFEGAYSVGETALHIAHEEEIEILYGIARQPPGLPPPYRLDAYPTKEAIKSLLSGVHARTQKFLESLSASDFEAEITVAWGEVCRPRDIVLHVLEHEIHHRGELSLILGLLGRPGLDA